MRISEIQPGQYFTRAAWAESNPTTHGPLMITKQDDGSLIYYPRGNPVNATATAHNYNDFFQCDENGVAISADQSITTASFVVLDSKNKLTAMQTMADVETHISAELDRNPRSSFSIFKLVAKVEPKRFTLSELITFVEDEQPEAE